MKKLLQASACALLTLAVTSAGAADAGAVVYKTNCAPCHGVTGNADTPAGKAFKAASFKSPKVLATSDADLLAITRKGKDSMPAWKGKLNDDQLKSVIEYIHTLQK